MTSLYSGWLSEITNSIDAVFYMAGSAMTFGGLLTFTLKQYAFRVITFTLFQCLTLYIYIYPGMLCRDIQICPSCDIVSLICV